MLTIRMDYADFEDFWTPMVYGQGKFGAYFDGAVSAGFGKMPSKNTKPADADASNGSKSTASDQPGSGGDEWPYSRIEGDKIIIE